MPADGPGATWLSPVCWCLEAGTCSLGPSGLPGAGDTPFISERFLRAVDVACVHSVVDWRRLSAVAEAPPQSAARCCRCAGLPSRAGFVYRKDVDHEVSHRGGSARLGCCGGAGGFARGSTHCCAALRHSACAVRRGKPGHARWSGCGDRFCSSPVVPMRGTGGLG